MSTKTDIWMPFYVADYLADTTRLTTEQHGAYMLLILDYWRNGPPPADDATLAQITRMPLDAWSNARSKVLAFFEQRDGVLVHSRIEREKVAAAGNKDKKTAKAKAAAEARWGKDASGNAPSNAQALPTQCPSPSPTPSPNGEDNLVGAGAPGGVERRQGNIAAIENILPAGPASLPGPPLPPAPPPPPPPAEPKAKAAKRHGTEEDFTAARWIFEQVRKLNATAKEPNWPAWANDVRLMREIDGRTHKEVCELFGWAMRDTFWCQNILSPGKLREKWDQLTVRRGQPAPGAARPAGQPSKYHGLNSLDHSGAEALHAASMKRLGIEQKPVDPNDPIDF